MANPKTISQRIALEGAEEIKRILADIGQVGEKAFAQISAATGPATKGLEAFAKASKAVEAEFSKFGSALSQVGNAANNFGGAVGTMATRVGLLAAAATAAGAAVFGLAKSSANAGDEIIKNAQATGLSTDAYQRLRFAASQAGVDTEQFGRGMTALSKQVSESAQNEAKALVTFVETVKKTTKEAGVVVIEAGRNFAAEFKVIGEAAERLQEKLKLQGIDVPLFKIKEVLTGLANAGAAGRTEFEKITGVALPSLNAGLDQLRKTAEGGGDALKTLGVRTTEVVNGITKVRDTESILLDAAEAFSKLADGPAKVALSTELLAKLGPKFAAFLNLGKEGIRELTADFEKSGLKVTTAQTRISEAMNDALSRLSTFAGLAKTQFGLLFAPTITKAADAFSEIILKNAGALKRLGEQVAGAVVPVIEDLVLLLSGKDNEVKNQWILEARDAIVAFGAAVKGAVLNIILPAFGALMIVLNTVAKAINFVFGTTLTGGQIGIAIVVAQLIGAFTVLGTGVLVVVAALKVLAVGVGLVVAGFTLVSSVVTAVATVIAGLVSWPVLIVVGLIAAAVAIVVFWDDIKKGALATWDYVKNLFAQPFADAWKWVVTTFDDAIEKLKKKAQEAADFIKKLLTGSADKTGASTIPGATPGETPVPLLGGASPFDKLPQSSNIEDRRGEATDQTEADTAATLERIKAFAVEVAAQIATVFAGLRDVATATLQEIVAAFTGGSDLIGTIVTGTFQRASDASTNLIAQLATAVQQMMDALASAVNSVIASVDASIAAVISRLEAAVQRAQELAAAAAAAASAAGGGGGGEGKSSGGFAGGGFVWGRGTSTSDSIPARLSRGEFVQRAAAVRYYGADLMAALNALRLPRDFLRGFSLGGLADGMRNSLAMPVMNFADGGLVPAAAGMPHMGTLDLRTDGGTVRLTVVRNDALEQLQRANVRRQLSRIGKPARG